MGQLPIQRRKSGLTVRDGGKSGKVGKGRWAFPDTAKYHRIESDSLSWAGLYQQIPVFFLSDRNRRSEVPYLLGKKPTQVSLS